MTSAFTANLSQKIQITKARNFHKWVKKEALMCGHVYLRRVMYGHVYQCRVMYGHVYPCRVMYNHVYPCRVMYGHVDLCRPCSESVNIPI